MRDAGPHVLSPTPREFNDATPTHMLKLDAVNVSNEDPVLDFTGPCVLDVSRGCKFRSHILSKSQVELSNAELPPLPSGSDRTQSLAGISSTEVALINRARQKMINGGYDADTLVLSDIHAYCFPLGW